MSFFLASSLWSSATGSLGVFLCLIVEIGELPSFVCALFISTCYVVGGLLVLHACIFSFHIIVIFLKRINFIIAGITGQFSTNYLSMVLVV